jgi:hypothetical protein
MQDIEQCRTEALGGHIYHCSNCKQIRYSYHSCKNRHCPKCQQDDTQKWLEGQQRLWLPVPYFFLTFTLPATLRPFARRYQKEIYHLLFTASAAALQQLAQDPRLVGGQVGLMGVLHTWTRDLRYHPHVHYLVPGGGLALDGKTWLPSRKSFFLPVKALSILFRAKFRDALQKKEWFDQVPKEVWSQDWVVHCQSVGNGVAALKYLAPYIFRVALSNKRIHQLADGQVTFSYRDSRSGETRFRILPAEAFIRRFLKHVLPKGFVKVRYYGLFSPGKCSSLPAIRRLLGRFSLPKFLQQRAAHQSRELRCPSCGAVMHWLQPIRPTCRPPP